ncbi:phage tail sheath family protein [Enterobacter kobei]|uniref:phage tail sheath family protein n=1 Tax=Enterobacter kobei TaxID=208224 RepID=UPI003CF8CBEF
MSINTSVPGVYIEENASPSISVSPGGTAVPLFIGRFKPIKSELAGVITRISSWLEYTTLFDATLSSAAYVTIKEPCDFAGFGAYDPLASLSLKLYFQNGGGFCYVYPYPYPYVYQEYGVTPPELNELQELVDNVGDITLLACTEVDEPCCTKVYTALSELLNKSKGYFLLANSADGNVPAGISPSSRVAVYYPDVAVPYIRKFDDKDVTVIYIGHWSNSLEWCRQHADKKMGTLCDKYLNTEIPKPSYIPPSALMAAVYCKTDRERGVWKAPANVVLSGVNDVSVRVTDDAQGVMNTAGVNVIRYFTGRGVTVWGARTLEADSDDWRYIPVRRLFDAAERDIKKALQSMVFEPNSQPTWKRVQAAVENYLYHLWKQGGLAGDKEEEAYFVRIGKDITMTDDDINQGKMIIQVGMAAVRPAEFIILQFTQDLGQ